MIYKQYFSGLYKCNLMIKSYSLPIKAFVHDKNKATQVFDMLKISGV